LVDHFSGGTPSYINVIGIFGHQFNAAKSHCGRIVLSLSLLAIKILRICGDQEFESRERTGGRP
ncbi:hypothetical protein, partial [Roseovarius atlanticus]|uniref:hypothetical protein n=1 Tax=Roseovarius atlanticus TaxID=1641875 RepID=UPI001F2B5D70